MIHELRQFRNGPLTKDSNKRKRGFSKNRQITALGELRIAQRCVHTGRHQNLGMARDQQHFRAELAGRFIS